MWQTGTIIKFHAGKNRGEFRAVITHILPEGKIESIATESEKSEKLSKELKKLIVDRSITDES